MVGYLSCHNLEKCNQVHPQQNQNPLGSMIRKENNSMKVFISQPMKDKTDEEIKAEREKAIQTIKEKYADADIDVLDSFFEKAPHDAKPLWFLGKSFEILADADLAYFCRGWNNYRGCNMEHQACLEYGIEIMRE